MNIQTLTLGPLATNCYLVRAEESRRAVIIDPAANSKRLLAALEEQGLTLEAILLTHAHFDHIGALKNLRAATNARVYIGGSSRDMAASLKRLSMLPPETRVLPGHGPSSTIEEELRTNPYLRGHGIE